MALPKGKRIVALTFDLCERPNEISGYQGALVDYLRANNIPATFFLAGKWMVNHPQRTQQLMADPLFEVAAHGWEHQYLRQVHRDVLQREIGSPIAAHIKLHSILTARQCLARDSVPASRRNGNIRLYRFPYGACDPESLKAVAAHGLLAIQWDVSTGDATQSASEMLDDVARNVKPGSIILMHANGRGLNTEEGLPKIVSHLKKKGYDFATVSDLLAVGKPIIVSSCYDLKPGDIDRYDILLRGEKIRGVKGPAVPQESGLSDD